MVSGRRNEGLVAGGLRDGWLSAALPILAAAARALRREECTAADTAGGSDVQQTSTLPGQDAHTSPPIARTALKAQNLKQTTPAGCLHFYHFGQFWPFWGAFVSFSPNFSVVALVHKAMTSGFGITRMILTSCQTYSVQCLQIVLPCRHCSANQTSAECCLDFIARGGYPMFHGTVWVSSSLSHSAG